MTLDTYDLFVVGIIVSLWALVCVLIIASLASDINRRLKARSERREANASTRGIVWSFEDQQKEDQ